MPPIVPRSVRSWTLPLGNSRIGAMAASDTELAVVLAQALGGLLEYVDARTDDYTEDDDVRALEDVGAVLHSAQAEAQKRLCELWSDEVAEMAGLE